MKKARELLPVTCIPSIQSSTGSVWFCYGSHSKAKHCTIKPWTPTMIGEYLAAKKRVRLLLQRNTSRSSHFLRGRQISREIAFGSWIRLQRYWSVSYVCAAHCRGSYAFRWTAIYDYGKQNIHQYKNFDPTIQVTSRTGVLSCYVFREFLLGMIGIFKMRPRSTISSTKRAMPRRRSIFQLMPGCTGSCQDSYGWSDWCVKVEPRGEPCQADKYLKRESEIYENAGPIAGKTRYMCCSSPGMWTQFFSVKVPGVKF